MQTAIVHDYLTQRGGAERVVLSLLAALPEAPVYTSLYAAERTFPEFRQREIHATGLNRFPPLRRWHRAALPLLAPAFSHLDVPGDVVVCSSSGWAHGARVSGRKVVYCHTPARWLYQTGRYLGGSSSLPRLAVETLRRPLEAWDKRAAASAARYLVNSTVVRDRVQELYAIEAEVLPPSPALTPDGPVEAVAGIEQGFVLCVSRLLPYKNVDAVTEAMRAFPDERLVIVGTGPDGERLTATAPANVRFLGSRSDAELRWLYAQSAALVAASYEDFGLTPLEAASFGKPAAVLRWGGFLDTVRENETGIFFADPTPGAVADALRAVLETAWDGEALREHAATFSEERFVERIRLIVEEEATR